MFGTINAIFRGEAMLTRHHISKRSIASRLCSWYLKRRFKPILADEAFDPIRFRKSIDRQMAKSGTASGVSIDTVDTPVKGQWLTPQNADGHGCILYCHGGGYLFGSAEAYQSFTSRLAAASGMRVFSLEYRLAPEYRYPAAAEDVLQAWQYLLNNHDPERIVVMGDSAGGGLALSLLSQLTQSTLPMPAAALVLSPYADLLVTGSSVEANDRNCAMFTAAGIRRAAEGYLDGANGAEPAASPMYADFKGFPPLQIYISSSEILRDDGMRVAERAAAADVPVSLHIWDNQPHVWPLFLPWLPEARQTLKEMASFAREHAGRLGT